MGIDENRREYGDLLGMFAKKVVGTKMNSEWPWQFLHGKLIRKVVSVALEENVEKTVDINSN
jgi:hypothetical protein